MTNPLHGRANTRTTTTEGRLTRCGMTRLGKDDAGNDALESQPADKHETVAKIMLLLEEKKD